MPEKYTPKQTGPLVETQIEQPKKEAPKILETFSVAAQTQELDFKALLEKPLFEGEGTYYLYLDGVSETFKRLVYESSQPVSGVEAMTIEKVELPERGNKQAMISELGAKPMSLNEWKHLFSQLTHEQLYGVSFFPVQLDDGSAKTIRVKLTSEGGGPYGYSVDFGQMSGETFRAQPFKGGHYDELKPCVFIRVEETK